MKSTDEPVPVHAIVPAAGLSRRMGRPKQILPYRGSTVLGTVVRTLLGAELDGVMVVTRTEFLRTLDLPADARVSVVINDNDTSQMIDSIRLGLASLFGAFPGDASEEPPPRLESLRRAGVLVLPGDMPGVTSDTCRRCIDAFRKDPTRIVVATHLARRGHPVIFPASLRPDVDRHPTGLDAFLLALAGRTTLVETADAATLKDVDTWSDYESIRPGPN